MEHALPAGLLELRALRRGARPEVFDLERIGGRIELPVDAHFPAQRSTQFGKRGARGTP